MCYCLRKGSDSLESDSWRSQYLWVGGVVSKSSWILDRLLWPMVREQWLDYTLQFASAILLLMSVNWVSAVCVWVSSRCKPLPYLISWAQLWKATHFWEDFSDSLGYLAMLCIFLVSSSCLWFSIYHIVSDNHCICLSCVLEEHRVGFCSQHQCSACNWWKLYSPRILDPEQPCFSLSVVFHWPHGKTEVWWRQIASSRRTGTGSWASWFPGEVGTAFVYLASP